MQKLTRPATGKGPTEWFTGEVFIDQICRGEAPSRARVAAVHFTPRARPAWHSHALGQTQHVTEGVGVIVTPDGWAIVMRPGDTVHTPPGERHWHGAVADQFMTHLAIWEGDDTTWGEQVTDQDYQQAVSA